MTYLDEKLTAAKDFVVKPGANITTSGTVADMVNAGSSVFSLTAATELDSMVASDGGKELSLINANTVNITVKNETGSTAANRITTGTGGDFTWLPGVLIKFSYDTGSSRWLLQNSPGGLSLDGSMDIKNLTINTSVAASAMTVAIKTKGSIDASATSPILVSMRSNTFAFGIYNVNSITGALSSTIPSGATLGQLSGVEETTYIYAIDTNNSGTFVLGFSTTLFDDSTNQNTSNLTAGSTVRTVLYTDGGALSNRPIKVIGKFTSTQTVAGTWASNVTVLSLQDLPDTLARTLSGDVSGSTIPRGRIGERVFQTVSTASAVSLTSGTIANVASVTLTPGIWDLTIVCGGSAGASAVGTNWDVGFGTSNSTLPGTFGDQIIEHPTCPSSTSDATLVLPVFRAEISTTTTYYFNTRMSFTIGTMKAYGRISAIRVG